MSVETSTMGRVQTWKQLEEKALEAVEKTYASVQGERDSFITSKYFKSPNVHAKNPL